MNVYITQIGEKNLERVNKILSGIPDGALKATYSAMKRAGSSAKTKAGQFAAAEYTISKQIFMQNVNSKVDVGGGFGGTTGLSISFAGTVLPLLTFNTKYSRNGLVTTQVKRNGGAATLQHAFVASIFGSTGVFERVGTPRFPVEQKFGPSTGHMMQNEEVVEKMDKTIVSTFEQRIDHEILRVLNGWGG